MIGPGMQIGSYRVLSLLGQGGMGFVFLAQHMALERRVALKVLRPECCQDRTTVARFFNEARAVNKVGHEHIVDVTDFGTTPDGQSYFVMEYLAGESLATRLRRVGVLPLDRALGVTIQVADALAASHAVGIVHRDLKPDNVFLIQRGGDPDYVKVLDFGIAKLLEHDGEGSGLGAPITQQSGTGTVLGTPHYMAPEQACGQPVDHRADVYSLGIILFQLCTGRVPFSSSNYVEVLVMHASQPCPRLRSVNPALPESLERIVERAVAKQRDQRFASMQELRDALAALQKELHGITARPAARPAPGPPADVATPARPPAAMPAAASSPGSLDFDDRATLAIVPMAPTVERPRPATPAPARPATPTPARPAPAAPGRRSLGLRVLLVAAGLGLAGLLAGVYFAARQRSARGPRPVAMEAGAPVAAPLRERLPRPHVEPLVAPPPAPAAAPPRDGETAP